jgi:adenosylcobinamide kinase/adenosylcobinamide-phosphate guanylyltransferase
VFVLGGARSGKSAFAEGLATQCGEPVLYIATATALDAEMADRIAQHRAQRAPAWHTLEAPTDVATAVDSHLGGIRTLLVEDLTLLLSNLMERDERTAEANAIQDIERLLTAEAHLILVSNEVGMGVVPAFPLGRLFRDALGRVNQRAAALCDEAHFLVAGIPLRLK